MDITIDLLEEEPSDSALLEEGLMAARADELGSIDSRAVKLMAAEIDRLRSLVTETQAVVTLQGAHLRAQTRSFAQLIYGRFNLVAGWYVLEVSVEYRPDRGRWHRQNPGDYTDRLDWAGVFTRDEVASYHNGKGPTTAVPVEQVLMEFEGPTALLRARIVERSNEIDSAGIPRANSLPGVAVELADFLQGAARRARSQAASTSEPEVRTLALAESIRLAGWARSLTDALSAGSYTTTSTPDQP